MKSTIVTISLVLLTLAGLAASVIAIARLLGDPEKAERRAKWQQGLIIACTLGSTMLFGFLAALSDKAWQPLDAHVDGLVLIAALLGAMVLYLQHPSRLPGVVAFAAPVQTLMLAWAICASSFTLEFFEIGSVWMTIHRAAVYLGTIMLAIAAIAGGMFLYAQKRLRRKDAPTGATRMASLETIEQQIIRTSAMGFGLLTLGLVTGLIVQKTTEAGWWYSPKVVLAAVVWLIYALVMNVRHATSFRGARAAWLSIIGMILLLAVMAISITPAASTGVN